LAIPAAMLVIHRLKSEITVRKYCFSWHISYLSTGYNQLISEMRWDGGPKITPFFGRNREGRPHAKEIAK
jgi:hypothetical protein